MMQRDCRETLAEGHRALEPLRDSRVLITGGTGFLGTWLTEMTACLNDLYGFNTRLLLASNRASSFKDRMPHLAARPDVHLMECDVRHIVDLPEDVAWVIHAACSPDSRVHVSDPLRTIDVLVNGTAALLSAAARLPNLRNILHVSSGWVYGAQPQELLRIPEDFWGALSPTSVSAAYAEGKRCAETVCAAYRNQQRLPMVTARPFTFIGPCQALDKPWAVNNFLRDALLGGPIRILGDPQTVRSFLYASDMAFWMFRALACGKDGQCFNIGSPEGTTLHELALKIAAQVSGGLEITLPNLSAKACPGPRFVPDTARAQESLGLKPTVGLDEAIRRTLAWNQWEQATA